jgi:hypothetical protein
VKQAVVEIADVDSVVLTKNGVVVGYVTVKAVGSGGDVEFVGRAVNVDEYYKSLKLTFHGFACGTAMSTDNANEVANVENFNKALAEVSK